MFLMKNSLNISIVALLFFILTPRAYAAGVDVLLDKTYRAAECQVFCADASRCAITACSEFDGISLGFEKVFSEELGIYPSGQIAVYVNRPKGGDAPYGGIDLAEDAVFVSDTTGKTQAIGEGLQVFEPGKVLLSFRQPFDDVFRKEMDFRVIVYFASHTQAETDNFRRLRIDDSRAFESYKEEHARDISKICAEFENKPGAPDACVSAVARRARTVSQQSNYYANQVEANKSRPFATLDTDRVFAFTRQPVSIKVLSVEDPDGICDDYKYLWDTSEGGGLNFVTDGLGNTTFIPLYPGEYKIRFRLQEDCPGNTLVSDPLFVPVKVTDRTTLFPDLPANHPDREYIFDLYTRGVIQGYPDGTVRPDRKVSRAEFLKMLFGTANVTIPPTEFSYAFPDVVDGEWYAPYVHFAKNRGIVEGYPDNYYRPNSPVNLVEALKIIFNITDIEAKENLDIWFGDVDATDWFSRYVTTAYREGILDVQAQQNVFPARLLTRGDVAELLVKTFLKPVNRINQVNINKL
jgi:hypothetical protein